MKHELYDIFVLKVNLRRTFSRRARQYKDARGLAGRAERRSRRGRCVWFFSPSLGSVWGTAARGAPQYSAVTAKCLTFTWSSRLVIVLYIPESFCFSCCLFSPLTCWVVNAPACGLYMRGLQN